MPRKHAGWKERAEKAESRSNDLEAQIQILLNEVCGVAVSIEENLGSLYCIVDKLKDTK